MDMPRIDAVSATGATSLAVRWRGGGESTVDLAGWLARPNPVLGPLCDPAVFARAAVTAHGSAVTWDDDEGDLAIDAVHLRLIADEQAPCQVTPEATPATA